MEAKNTSKIKTIALVSGKGGSGKTMIAATIAQLFDSLHARVLLVDSDFATGGLTYYMGLKNVRNTSIGLTKLISSKNNSNFILDPMFFDLESNSKIIQKIESFQDSYFIGVGDHRRFYNRYNSDDITSIISNLITAVKNQFDIIIFDCRGGIDNESLSVCGQVEDIILIVEADTTSFQATQHLVDVLYDNHLSDRISGFIINKVFDNPSSIAMNGTAAFRTQYLGSIPFDIGATRSFLIGEIPKKSSLFSSQLAYGMEKFNTGIVITKTYRKMDFEDFKGLDIKNKDSIVGGIMLSFMNIALVISLFLNSTGLVYLSTQDTTAAFVFLMLSVMLSSVEQSRQIVGRIIFLYVKFALK